MMTAPIIGLTTRNALFPKYGFPIIASPKSYIQALIKAGAIPVLIPVNLPIAHIHELLARLDGIIFTGGGDIATERFDGLPHEKVYDVDPERDEIEFQLIKAVEEINKPFLGICRGFQVINVAHGGTLLTHINDQMQGAYEHSAFPAHETDYEAHEVVIEEDSRLAGILGTNRLKVNSLHHQGVKDIGQGLKLAARSTDGLVEAVEVEGQPFGLAVQWHPEWMPDSEQMQALLSAFVEAARNGK
jgi:putative glutamine amidotransferase